LVFGTVTLDEDPVALYELATKQVERERAEAVALGRRVYGARATDWNALARLILADPKNKFATPEEVRDFTQRTYDRAYAAANKMVLTPPVGPVKLEPFLTSNRHLRQAGNTCPQPTTVADQPPTTTAM